MMIQQIVTYVLKRTAHNSSIGKKLADNCKISSYLLIVFGPWWTDYLPVLLFSGNSATLSSSGNRRTQLLIQLFANAGGVNCKLSEVSDNLKSSNWQFIFSLIVPFCFHVYFWHTFASISHCIFLYHFLSKAFCIIF